jgi:lysophosphatidate acyltransferase
MSCFLFPEGTRSHQRDNSMLPFKKGAFHLAISGQFSIVPLVFSTYGDVCDSKRRRFEGGDIRIKVLPRISTKGMTSADVDTLVQMTHEKMMNALVEVSSKPIVNKKEE